MKIKLLKITFLLILFQNKISIATDNKINKNPEKEFNQILVNLDSLILSSKNQHETLANHYNFIKNKINNNELPIVFDTTLNYNFYGCASFNISADNPKNINISFGRFLIDKYKKHPALVNAIMIYTFQAAYDYYNNYEQFLIGTKNPIEKTFFEIDAMTLEALFLTVYMKDFPELGPLEKYLIADLPNRLYGSSMLFNKTDLELLHKMNKLKSEEKSATKLLKEFNNIGKELLKTKNFNSPSNWVNYCSIVSLRTYIFYGQQVIFDIVHLKNGVSQNDFKLENYKENHETIKQVQSIVKSNNNYFSYHDETLNMFGDYYKR